MSNESKRLKVIRIESFNAAHRLHNPSLSDSENEKIFGKCNNFNYHGHNYKLEVHVTGCIDPVTGYVIDLKILKNIIKEEVLDRFDHRNLNLDVDDFKQLNPTAENIAIVIYEKIVAKLGEDYDVIIHLHETDKNSVVYPC